MSPHLTNFRDARLLRFHPLHVFINPAAVKRLTEIAAVGPKTPTPTPTSSAGAGTGTPAASDATGTMIKVGVKTRGCSGLQYTLDFTKDRGKYDEVVTQDGVTVLVESKALLSVLGSEMDFVEDKLSSQFVFNNPNVKESCGCGQSFMV